MYLVRAARLAAAPGVPLRRGSADSGWARRGATLKATEAVSGSWSGKPES